MLTKQTQIGIKEHYDKISPYYQKLWGNHIHHGYYITGKESIKKATENLIRFLVKKSEIKRNSSVFDIGCGVGGTSIWLAKNYKCKVTGMTISPIQVKIAKQLSNKANLKPKPTFFVADANKLDFKEKYDVLWCVEMISHLKNRKDFFTKCSRLLEKGGKLVITDWFKNPNLSNKNIREIIHPIEKGMLVSLWTSQEYRNILEESGLKLKYYEDISENVKKTWDVCLDIIEDTNLWNLAVEHGEEFVHFLKAFESMKDGFASGALRYEVLVFEKK